MLGKYCSACGSRRFDPAPDGRWICRCGSDLSEIPFMTAAELEQVKGTERHTPAAMPAMGQFV